jgi:diguanylate cyclase (GGDEF)-like protein
MGFAIRGALHKTAVFAAATGLYYLAGKLGLQLAFYHPSATPVWPPTGMALAGLLLLGYEVAPAFFFGAFLVNLTTAGTIATSLGIATGNTLEGLVAAWLITHYAGGRRALETPGNVVRFAAFGAVLGPVVGATVGVTTLALGSLAPWSEFAPIWLTWWLGDMGGALIVAPALLLWANDWSVTWDSRRALEATGLLAGLVLITGVVFAQVLPLEFLAMPLLVWAAYRFSPREAATAVLVLAALAVWGTLRSSGPFSRTSPNESLLLLQAFLAVLSVTTLMLATLVRERRDVESRLRQLAGTDPLTGLANYRQLVAALESEVQRSGRTGRSFALVLFDLDGLKAINDTHGHLTGSRALCRLADALRRCHRSIDTAARYGGDEFALVLPETTAAPARRAAARVARMLAEDGELPMLAVTSGVAVYPRDGGTLDGLIEAADRVMYEGKKARFLAETPLG